MNKQRRATIERAIALLSEAQQIIEEASSEEQDYFDNMPESLQGSERGQAAETAASSLIDISSSIEDLVGELQDAIA